MKKGRRFWLTTICILLTAALLLPGCVTQLPEQTDLPREGTYEIHYIRDDPRKYFKTTDTTRGDLEEELRPEQLSQILPEQMPAGITASGYTVFTNHDDTLGVSVRLWLETGNPDITIQIAAITTEFVSERGIWDLEPVSIFNGVPFRVFEFPLTKEETGLMAVTQKEGFFFNFTVVAPNKELGQARSLYEETLMCFTYEEKLETPNWSAIQPRYSGEYFYKELTLEEAQKDSRYGYLILGSVPEGYVLDYGYRNSSFHGDYLQLSWTRRSETAGQAEKTICWGCEQYDPEWNSVAMSDPADYTDRETGSVIYEMERLMQPCQHRYLDYIASHGILLFGIKKGEDLLWIKSAGETQWVKEQLYAICGVEPIDPWECESWNGPDEEYYQDAEFGAYLPRWRDWMRSPAFVRHKSETENCLSGDYFELEEDDGHISWHISYAEDSVAKWIVDIEEEETYSLSGYSNPWDYTIPEENRETIRCPVFPAEKLTLETVSSRVYCTEDEPDIMRMQFDVQYDDVIVSIHAVGVTPERVYELIDSIRTDEAEMPE